MFTFYILVGPQDFSQPSNFLMNVYGFFRLLSIQKSSVIQLNPVISVKRILFSADSENPRRTSYRVSAPLFN